MPDNYPSNATSGDLAKRIDEKIDLVKRSRRKWELQSLVNMHFVEGSNLYWSNSLASVQTVPLQKEVGMEDKKTINFGRKLLRGAKNVITANDPRWHVRNSDGVDASTEEKDGANKLLQSIYRKQGIKGLLKDTLDYAFLRTFAVGSVMFSHEKDDVDVQIWDPLDVYPYPCVPDPADWLCVTLCSPVNKHMLRRKYGDIVDTIQASSKLYESDVKASFEGSKGQQQDPDMWVLHQTFEVDFYEEEMKPKKKAKKTDPKIEEEASTDTIDTIDKTEEYNETEKKVRITKTVKVGDVILEDSTQLEYESMNELFAVYFAERRAGQLYSIPWMTDVIRLNDSLNRNFTSADEYDRILAKGRWMAERGTKVSMVSSQQHGQIVRYEGIAPIPMDTPNLPQSVLEHREFLIRMMEDVGGIHSDSLGRRSGSADSGRALSILVAQDQQNVAEPVDNLEDFMAKIARMILSTASKYYTEVRKIYFDDKEMNEDKSISVIGADAAKKLDDVALQKESRDKALKIHNFDDVTADIIPGSAFSDLQAFDMLMQAKQAGVKIPDSEIIESMKIGSAWDFIRRFETETSAEEAKSPDMLIAEGIIKKMVTTGQFIPPDPQYDLRAQLPIFGQALQALGQGHPAAPLLMKYMMMAEQLLGQAPHQTDPTAPQPATPDNTNLADPGGGGIPPLPQGAPDQGIPPAPPKRKYTRKRK